MVQKSVEWVFPTAVDQQVESLFSDAQISPICSKMLWNRGVREAEEARHFLAPALENLPSPVELSGMTIAVARVIRAIQTGERILVFGDYDLDGVSSSVVMHSVLQHYQARVELFVPDRARDGYGLQIPPLERLLADAPALIITCDNGTSAHEAIAFANGRGSEVIVTDHHTVPEVLPDATAILNPRLEGNPPELQHLSGVGVAFCFVMVLRQKLRELLSSDATHPNLKRLLDLVALGTVADVVPLIGVNRLLVHFGLKEIAKRARPGLRALLEVSGAAISEPVTAATVGFGLAPRLNASGRLGSAHLAVALLTTDDSERAKSLAAELDHLNTQRQRIERDMTAEIKAELEDGDAELGLQSHVFASSRWHQGVVGIVAARIAELVHRPVFVLSIKDGIATGSGRSISSFDLMEALKKCAVHLLRYGGHRAAAGASLREEDIAAFRAAFSTAARDQFDKGLSPPQLHIDSELNLEQLDQALMDDVARLAPFGEGNRQPTFVARGLRVVHVREVGQGHLKATFRQGEAVFPAIGFGMFDPERPVTPNSLVSIAFCPEVNVFRGRSSIQLRLLDLRVDGAPSEPRTG